MKTHELAKELGIKTTQVIDTAAKLKLRRIAVNSGLTDEEVQLLRSELIGTVAEVKPIVTQHQKKGSFLGTVYDGEKFVNARVALTFDEIQKFEHEILSEHTTIFGAIVEVVKKIHRVINENTVKVFKR